MRTSISAGTATRMTRGMFSTSWPTSARTPVAGRAPICAAALGSDCGCERERLSEKRSSRAMTS
jgi:hypothetical protein